MRRPPRSLDTALISLLLATVVTFGLTDEGTGWQSTPGRSLLALRLTSGVAVLVAALGVPVTLLMRWRIGGRDARRWKAKKAALLATLDWVSRSGNMRGERSPSEETRCARPEVEPAARIDGAGLGEGPGIVRVAGSTGEATVPGLAVDVRLAVPRDLGAEVGGLPLSDQLTAFTMEVGIVPMARPAGQIEPHAAGDLEGLGPIPARWGPGVPDPVGPGHRVTGLTIDIVACSDEEEIMTLTLGCW